jgi:hypothetical protein
VQYPKVRGDEQEPDTRCGTYTRDELARDSEVLHPQRGVRCKSGVYAWKVLRLTPEDLQTGRKGYMAEMM